MRGVDISRLRNTAALLKHLESRCPFCVPVPRGVQMCGECAEKRRRK